MTVKIRFATARMDGCAGCHRCFVDVEKRLPELAGKVDVVYNQQSPAGEFPDHVDITLVEGALGTDVDLKNIRDIRDRTKILVAFGDCAIMANNLTVRYPANTDLELRRIYQQREAGNKQVPIEVVPIQLSTTLPLHKMVKIDLFVPGCPPSGEIIFNTLKEMIDGRVPDLTSLSRFGS